MKELFYPFSIVDLSIPILEGKIRAEGSVINTSYPYKEGHENILNHECEFLRLCGWRKRMNKDNSPDCDFKNIYQESVDPHMKYKHPNSDSAEKEVGHQ